VNLSFAPYELKFKRPFSIAHGTRNSTPVVFTRLEHNGIFGYGEAAMPPYLSENHETVLRFLDKAKNMLQCFSNPLDIEIILTALDKIEKGNTAAKASVDIALHDLFGKICDKTCHAIFHADKTKPLYTAYTIPIDEPGGIKKRIEEAKDHKMLKVKLGSANDKQIIEEICKQTDKEIFVDVNEGWTDKFFALDMAHWLAERKTLFIEQPLQKEKIDDIAWLTANSPIPIIADEAVQQFSDLEQIKDVYTGINVKLMKCTGLHEAHKMILKAREYDLKIMLGCMSESSCGVSAAAQLAPLVDWIDLDGPLLIKEDYFSGVQFSEGRIWLNNRPGIGVEPIHNLAFQ